MKEYVEGGQHYVTKYLLHELVLIFCYSIKLVLCGIEYSAILPRVRMVSESIAHEAKGRIGY